MKHYKIEIQKKYLGFEYTVLALDLGHRCGYVKIPPGHPLFGLKYNQNISGYTKDFLKNKKIGKRGILSIITSSKNNGVSMDVFFNVHGSITFAGNFSDKRMNGYWIGFDCAHSGDGRDISIMSKYNLDFWKQIGRSFKKTEKELNYKNKLLETDSVGNFAGDHIWKKNEVESECKSLIRQIIKYFPNK